MPTKEQFKSKGGKWLGAVRNWIQWNCINGDSVTWGSNEELRMSRRFTVKVIEEIGVAAAYAQLQNMQEELKSIADALRTFREEETNDNHTLGVIISRIDECSGIK
jgi:hypothetical protein